jgi:hypothetical protein
MADCTVNGFLAPSGNGFLFEARDSMGNLVNVATVSDNGEVQQIVITSRPTGDAIQLTRGGQTTAPIPTPQSPPAAFGEWSFTGITPGQSRNLAVNIPQQGGTGSPNCRYEVLDDTTSLGHTDLNHQADSGFGGVTNPTPFTDGTLDVHGAAVRWFPLGTGPFTTSAGTLRVRISCPGNDGSGRNLFSADQCRMATTDGLTVTRHDSATGFTFAALLGGQSRTLFNNQCADSSVDTFYVPTGLGVDPTYPLDPARVQSALEALSTGGSGNFAVAGNGFSYLPCTVKFVGALGGASQPLLVASEPSTTQVTEVVAGGSLPVVTVHRHGGGTDVYPMDHDWLYFNSIQPSMPTIGFFPPVPMDPSFEFAVAWQRDNALRNSNADARDGDWYDAYNFIPSLGGSDPGHGVFGYTPGSTPAQNRHALGTDPIATYCYRPTPQGQYRASVTWPAAAGLSTDVVYTVYDLDGNVLGTYHVDQTVAPSGGGTFGGVPFRVLGTYTLGRSVNGGHLNGLTVVQTNAAGGVMVADAARFELLSLAAPTITIGPLDTATFSAGHGWFTAVGSLTAPVSTNVTMANKVGGTLYDATRLTPPTTIRMGYNVSEMVSKDLCYYTNFMLRTSSLDSAYPTVLNGQFGSVLVCDSHQPVGADQKSPPNLRVGDYDILWKGDTEISGNNQISAGSAEDVSRRIFPGVDAHGYHRKTYALSDGAFNYGSELSLTIAGTSIIGSGPNWNYDFHDLWVVPKDTDVTTAPLFNPWFTSIVSGSKVLRFLDPLGGNGGNCADFGDYTRADLSRNLKGQIAIPLSGHVTIQQYTGSEYPEAIETGVFVELAFDAAHGLKLGQSFLLDGYTGDLVHVSDGTRSYDLQLAANLNQAYPLAESPNKLLARLFINVPDVGDMSGFRMTNTITNAGGALRMFYGATMPISDVVAACNLDGSDLHWNTHFANTDACLFSCGQFIGQHLGAGQKLWVECSNEVWNIGQEPESWATAGTALFFGGSANDYIQYYCETAHERHHAQMRAGWVAAGRDPADFKTILGSILFDTGKTSSVATYYHSKGWTFDKLVVANYMENAPSAAAPATAREFPFYRVVDGFSPGQHLDMLEAHTVYGKYELEVPNHVNAMTGGGARPEFASVQVGFYEGGNDILLVECRDDHHSFPYGLLNNGWKNHAVQRHPRLYGIDQIRYVIAQDSGCVSATVFQLQGGDTQQLEAWGTYFAQDQLPYAPGDPAQDAIQINQVENTPLLQSIAGGAVKALQLRFSDTPGSLTAGHATAGSATATTASASATDATGGTTPYTYRWYRSTTSGVLGSAVTTGGGTETTRSLADAGLTPSTAYYYTLRYTDAAAATADSNQVAVSTSASSPTGSIVLQDIPAFRNLRVA